MKPTPPNDFLPLAIKASELASQAILDVYHSPNFEVEAKGDNSPLTLADKKAHDIIAEILKPTSLPILSEEGKSIPFSTRKNWKTFWMVDPLDGTKEFIKRNGEFTVNIALIENQKPVLGVVAVPVTGEIYHSAQGMGAFKIQNSKSVQLKKVEKVDLKSIGIRVVASRSHLSPETQQFIDSLNNPQLVSKGSSLKFMMLADGVADVYPRFAPTMEWDTAAAHAVVNELGIRVVEKDTNRELHYNKENLLNPFFMVY
jgi:3'(2'), 5'-bisphosphate nucleotidase